MNKHWVFLNQYYNNLPYIFVSSKLINHYAIMELEHKLNNTTKYNDEIMNYLNSVIVYTNKIKKIDKTDYWSHVDPQNNYENTILYRAIIGSRI